LDELSKDHSSKEFYRNFAARVLIVVLGFELITVSLIIRTTTKPDCVTYAYNASIMGVS
jgi:hypothetical protein